MANVRALSTYEFYSINKAYTFDLIDDNKYIVVSCINYPNRKTIHPANQPFYISAKKRKVKITQKAIDLWIEKYHDEFSLIEVQNAISSLIVTYQDILDENIDSQLKRKTPKIKEV